jgi:hypothetical protein
LVDASTAAATAAAAAAADGLEYQEPADVAAERRKVEAMQSYANHPIVVKHLQKTYPSRDGQPPKVSKEIGPLWLVLSVHAGSTQSACWQCVMLQCGSACNMFLDAFVLIPVKSATQCLTMF